MGEGGPFIGSQGGRYEQKLSWQCPKFPSASDDHHGQAGWSLLIET